ncbi:pentatricopeptide repeat-containing protein At1g62260, mitochondrial [Beta vulgaris subsp. vulgaris]|uniref:pentatricopeptide repeat-containing protein At1g62260, mitochondrial n=1 Tax=Beta vulgaris subsp. vulgaris TaxID=3555 RepID=UPI002036685B|nr:pentatricopeptide repeat-containing protein At1g62260, mitochondrial [Beta vulgaris subsp. vulgaris]XP_010683889.2 pentatricopeptide repeat-containing protein At1g62260, mitochondrial [Beta vulgaris subsp. vulgaris]
MQRYYVQLERILHCPFRLGIHWRRPMCYHTPNYYGAQCPDLRVWNKHITQLIRNGRFSEARSLFDRMSVRNTITWNSMMSGYVKDGEIWKARRLFDEMPDNVRDVVSWNLMISGYVSRRGAGMRYVEEGKRLFDQMPKRDLVSWNTMISGYARVGRMDDALCLFKTMSARDVITWNAMVTGFLQNGDADRAIEWFRKMPKRDASSLSALISGLIRIDEWDKAKEILLECGKEVENEKQDLVQAYNTLIAGYGQKGRVDEARSLFDQMSYCPYGSVRGKIGVERNVVSWNAMIMSYIKVGDVISARELFNQMVDRDTFSWNTMISGYVQTSDMEQAAQLFSQMPNPDIMSWNMMVSGYAQSGNLDSALDFFNRTPQRNLVSWNSVIAGCDKNGDYEGAIKLFIQMQIEEVKPDRHTLSSILSVCTGVSALHLGRQIHQLITKTLIADIPINNSLVTMYSMCGAITEARFMFDEMGLQKDVISWNAIIGGYASHGYAAKALEIFEEMKRIKVQPTVITFVSVLNACAHAGLLKEARNYFKSMLPDFGIQPGSEHYAVLVDIVGRHGHLQEALDLVYNMPHKPNKAIWGALLGACRIHNNVELAQVASEALSKLEPESSAPYVLLHNMFVDVEQWEDAKNIRNAMNINNIRKGRGSSWLERVTSEECCY